MNYLLFTSPHCPKCPGFKDFVQKHVPYEGKVLAPQDADFQALSREFVIHSVPTLLIFEDPGQEALALRTSEVTEVYDFVLSH